MQFDESVVQESPIKARQNTFEYNGLRKFKTPKKKTVLSKVKVQNPEETIDAQQTITEFEMSMNPASENSQEWSFMTVGFEEGHINHVK